MTMAAVAAALATRFSGVTAGGESIVVGPTARLPNAINKGPALLVYPPAGQLRIVARQREDILTFPVRLLRDPLDVPTRTDALYAWADALRDVVEKDMDLGLPTEVAWARPSSLRAELDGEEYGGRLFDVVELLVDVRLIGVVSTIST